jgi:hypothetical protein
MYIVPFLYQKQILDSMDEGNPNFILAIRQYEATSADLKSYR